MSTTRCPCLRVTVEDQKRPKCTRAHQHHAIAAAMTTSIVQSTKGGFTQILPVRSVAGARTIIVNPSARTRPNGRSRCEPVPQRDARPEDPLPGVAVVRAAPENRSNTFQEITNMPQRA